MGSEISRDSNIAESLNEYFSSVGSVMAFNFLLHVDDETVLQSGKHLIPILDSML